MDMILPTMPYHTYSAWIMTIDQAVSRAEGQRPDNRFSFVLCFTCHAILLEGAPVSNLPQHLHVEMDINRCFEETPL